MHKNKTKYIGYGAIFFFFWAAVFIIAAIAVFFIDIVNYSEPSKIIGIFALVFFVFALIMSFIWHKRNERIL